MAKGNKAVLTKKLREIFPTVMTIKCLPQRTKLRGLQLKQVGENAETKKKAEEIMVFEEDRQKLTTTLALSERQEEKLKAGDFIIGVEVLGGRRESSKPSEELDQGDKLYTLLDEALSQAYDSVLGSS